MSLKYADERVQEALTQCGGNQAKAQQLIITWAMTDQKLLQALTRHHLKGIVAYHVERVASGRAERTAQPLPEKPKKAHVAEDDSFGQEILKAVADSSSAVFGLEGYSGSVGKGKASQRHIDAIRKLASRTTKS